MKYSILFLAMFVVAGCAQSTTTATQAELVCRTDGEVTFRKMGSPIYFFRDGTVYSFGSTGYPSSTYTPRGGEFCEVITDNVKAVDE